MKDISMPRVSFTGYYGMKNFGDDLFGAICDTAARKYWGAESTLVGPPIPGVRLHSTMPAWYPARVYGSRGLVGKASRLYSFGRAIRSSDILVMGGGSVIGSRQSFRKSLMASAKREKGLRLAAIGVSIGPLEDVGTESVVADFIDMFDYVSVRDRRSYELAMAMGLAGKVHLGRDLAGMLSLEQLEGAGAREKMDRPLDASLRIGVAPCNYGRHPGYDVPDKQAVRAALVEGIRRVAQARKVRVDIFSLNEHGVFGDFTESDALAKRLVDVGVEVRLIRYAGQSPFSIIHSIGSCDAFVSARLHGAISAYMLGTPFALIDYHPKCHDFANDIGLHASLRLTAARHGVEDVGAALATLLGAAGVPLLPPRQYAREAQQVFTQAPWSIQERFSHD